MKDSGAQCVHSPGIMLMPGSSVYRWDLLMELFSKLLKLILKVQKLTEKKTVDEETLDQCQSNLQYWSQSHQSIKSNGIQCRSNLLNTSQYSSMLDIA